MEQLTELLSACVAPVNIFYTVLMVAMVIYWISVILGALDLDVLNMDTGDVGEVGGLDLDADADVDVGGDAGGDAGGDLDADADADADADGDDGGQGQGGVLRFFNFGEVPVTIILSFAVLSMWIISILGNDYLQNESLLIAAVGFFPNLVASMIVAKILSSPFKRVFRALNIKGEGGEQAIGRFCRVATSEATETFGQVEIKTRGAPLLLNARTPAGEKYKKGDLLVVVRRDAEKDLYHVRAPGWREKRRAARLGA